MGAIEDDLFDFLNEFGIFLELDETTTSLKYQFFPTHDVRQRLQFGHETRIEDNFFDQFDTNQQQFIFDPSRVYRERNQLDRNLEFVRLTSLKNNSSRCLLSVKDHVDKDKSIQNEGLQSYLNLQFVRSYSSVYQNVYLDRLTIPQIEQPYEVVSIKIKIINIQNIREEVKLLFDIAYNLTLDDETLLNKNYSQHLLQNNQLPIFPMYSKYMYAFQMSEFYKSYFEFSMHDPVADPLETRLNIIYKDTVNTPSYNKLWMWFMVYQIHYFHTRLDNFPNKIERAPIARGMVEEVRKKIFDDEQIQLVDDEDDDCIF
jgi:hypothetical protein